MKSKLLFASITFLFFSVGLAGQEITTTAFPGNNVLQKIQDASNQKVTELHEYSVSFNIPDKEIYRTAEDSASMSFTQKTVEIKKVRLNPEVIGSLFPEAVEIGADEEKYIDYTSIIAILFESLNQQQRRIEELEQRIIEVEDVATK